MRARLGELGTLVVTAAALVSLLAAAVLYPSGLAGNWAVLLVAALGAYWLGTQTPSPMGLLAAPAGRAGTIAAYVATLGVAGVIFGSRLWDGEVFDLGDWGIHHTMIRRLAADLGSGAPTYLQGVSTGDSPYELYPVLAYWILAIAARVLSMESDIPTLLTWFGVLAHTALALGVIRLATRLGASAVIAGGMGLVSLLDEGHLFSGGAMAVLHFGLVQQTLALLALVFAASELITAVKQPTLVRALAIQLGLAMAALAHPIGVIACMTTAACILAGSLLSNDLPGRRAAILAGHCFIGLCLGAAIWAPYAARVLAHGVHYPNPAVSLTQGLTAAFAGDWPRASFPIAVIIGYLGCVAGLFSRRAGPAMVGLLAGGMLLLATDLPFILGGLAPSGTSARFASFRPPAVAKPFVFAAAAFGVTALLAAAARGRPLSIPKRGVACAIAAVALLIFLRGIAPIVEERSAVLRGYFTERAGDATSWNAFVEWARERAAENRPESFGRLYYDGFDHYIFELAAQSGLPVIHPGPIPGLFLRERMSDTGPESLRRFDIRWVASSMPLRLGDRDTEQRFGPWAVREVAGWDGAFARVERGEGAVRTVELDDMRVVVELTGARSPSLVAFGMGYYGRWRAVHESGRAVPIYGMRASRADSGRVVSAWLPPGRTVLTADGALPSDGLGVLPSFVGVLLLVLTIVAYRSSRVREVLLRGWNRTCDAMLAWRRQLLALGLAVVAVELVILGSSSADRPAPALEVLSGFASDAYIESRDPNGEWTPCSRFPLLGMAHCGTRGRVFTTIGASVNNQPQSWPYSVPAITVVPDGPADYRITMERYLEGRYLYASWDRLQPSGSALRIEGMPEMRFTGATQSVDVPGAGMRRVVVELSARQDVAAGVSFIRLDAIDRDRTADVPEPPDGPL